MKQGVTTIAVRVTSEYELASAFEDRINLVIASLNNEGKHVINIVNAGSAQTLLGVIHIFTLLWEIPDEEQVAKADEAKAAKEIDHRKDSRQYNTLTITTENVDNLLETVAKSISEKDFEKAENYCTQILDYFPHHARANILRLLIDYKAYSVEELVVKRSADAITSNPYYIEAVKNGGVNSCPEYIQIQSMLGKIENDRAKREEEHAKRLAEMSNNTPEQLQYLYEKGEITH